MSLKDILFQFLTLFSFGCFIALIFIPAETIGYKFFSTQALFSIFTLAGALSVHFYRIIVLKSAIPLFSYVYISILVILILYYVFIIKHRFLYSWCFLIVNGILCLIGLYAHSFFLMGDVSSLFQFMFTLSSFASVSLIGCVFTAMMLCHWFFVFHKLPIKYLKRMSHLFTYAVIFKILSVGVVLWLWKLGHLNSFGQVFPLDNNLTLLYLRFGIGLFIPLILSFGSDITIKIPANHSAIGILYLAVILVFMGEVLGQYLTLIHQIPL